MSINEKISKFIGNNLEKVSNNTVYPQPTQTPVKSFAPSEEFVEHSISSFKYIIIFFVIILLFAIVWYYIKKYYPEWKKEFLQFYDESTKKIYNFFHPQKTETKPSEPQTKNLLTKAQINNFPEKEKEHTEPQPNDRPSFFENKLFDRSDNLNSNKILDYLLNKENDVKEWCFIGESKGERHCTITQGNACMSGNVFPTRDICINPKLRSPL